MGNKVQKEISKTIINYLRSEDCEPSSDKSSEIEKKEVDENNKEQLDLESYINDPKLINSDNIKELIELIQSDLKREIVYKIPFLKICPNLVKLYIESELDEFVGKENEKRDKNYYEVFEELKKKCFINRNYLNPIYEYFSYILYNLKNIKDDDKKLLKFPKVLRLWKIFYNNNLKQDIDDENQFSSICFNGGYLKLILLKDNFKNMLNAYKTKQDCFLKFYISSIKGKINKLSKIISIKIKDEEKLTEVYFPSTFETKEINIKGIIIEINENMIKIYFDTDTHKKENVEIIMHVDKIFKKIEKIYILKGFYGEIKKIDVSLGGQSIQNIESQKFELFKEVEEVKKVIKIFEIKYSNQCANNLINYLDKKFNIFDYFGGLKPLIPFISLINEIYASEIKNIGGKGKIVYLQQFISDIFCVLNQYYDYNKETNKKINNIYVDKRYIINDKSKDIKKLEKNTIFFLSLLYNSEIIPKDVISYIINNINNKEKK